jgi:hypothetical protein
MAIAVPGEIEIDIPVPRFDQLGDEGAPLVAEDEGRV